MCSCYLFSEEEPFPRVLPPRHLAISLERALQLLFWAVLGHGLRQQIQRGVFLLYEGHQARAYKCALLGNVSTLLMDSFLRITLSFVFIFF